MNNLFLLLSAITLLILSAFMPTKPVTTVETTSGLEYKIITIASNKFVAYKVKGEYQLVPLH